MNNMTSTALQVTDFNFYGDNLIAHKHNSTREIYTAITHILKSDHRWLLFLDTCFTLDAIEHNKEIKTLYEAMIDNLLTKYNLTENLSDTKYKTIFDN